MTLHRLLLQKEIWLRRAMALAEMSLRRRVDVVDLDIVVIELELDRVVGIPVQAQVQTSCLPPAMPPVAALLKGRKSRSMLL